MEPKPIDLLYQQIRQILLEGRKRAAMAVNFATVESYCLVG